MQLLMVVMEWVALLLGLLPLGGRRGRWSPGRTALAVVIAGLTLLMDLTFFIIYILCMKEVEMSRLDMIVFIAIALYALGKSIAVSVMLWFKGDVFSSLILSLRKATQFQAETPAHALKFVLFFSCILVECGLSMVLHVIWLTAVPLSSQPSMIRPVFPIIRSFAMFSLPLIDVFPLMMLVSAGHLLRAALADANVSLKLEIERQDFVNPKESLRLRSLCFRYIHLRGLHQQLSDILAIPLMSWSLEKLLLLISTTYSFISYGKYLVGTFLLYLYAVLILMGAVSLFMLCHVIDCMADEAAEPMRIITQAELNLAGEVIRPEVAIEVVRLLKVCERPLVIRPLGLYTISRSNMLSMLSAISTYLVVLLQFQPPMDIPLPSSQQGNESMSR